MRYSAAIFLSAFLLFLVQSVAGKQLLPWFGGTPATWAACMLFFQLLLLGGYLYAWALDRWCARNWQRTIHLAVMAGAVVLLVAWAKFWGAPLLAPENWKPSGDESPVALILKVLTAGVGLPFFALAANSPLLQRWASEWLPEHRVYRLYAVSNAGSLLGLLSFPFVFEPRLALPELASLWGWIFGALVLAILAAVFWPRRSQIPAGAAVAPTSHCGTELSPSSPESMAPTRARDWILWILLAAVASAMFLATTNQLCQEISLVPLLWVLPLAVYLTAFMITFHDARWYPRAWLVPIAAVATLAILACAFLGVQLPIPHQIVAHSIFLLVFSLVCLGELYRSRPGAARLTGFYLAIAIGGALGGAAISLGAPLWLETTAEFHVTVLAGWLVLAVAFILDRESPFFTGGRWFFFSFLFVIAIALLRLAALLAPAESPSWVRFWWIHAVAALAVAAAAAVILRRRDGVFRHTFWPRAIFAGIVLVAELFMLDRMRSASAGRVAENRNFFGAVRVQQLKHRGVAFTQLTHGQINHGFQYDDPTLRRQPAGYCNPDSGVGLALTRHPRRDHRGDGKKAQPMRIGVAGLGVGAMASYVRQGDVMRFYEINPLVIDYAAGPRPHFTYIQDAAGTVDTVLGDARISLEREWRSAGSRGYDVLILDAFSSDSVPVHLLTVEAFELYLRHLRDADSLLAVNISNRFLDFRPLLFSLARRFNLEVRVFLNPGNLPVPTPNLWALLGASPNRHEFFDLAKDWPSRMSEKEVLWTDNHSNIFSLLRWDQRPQKVVIIEPPPAAPAAVPAKQ